MCIGKKFERTYVYRWYDRCLLRETKIPEWLVASINNHDWETFKELRDMMNLRGCYLPDKIAVFFKSGRIKNVKLNKKTFMRINRSECEAG